MAYSYVMLEDAYVTTRTVDSVEIRIITREIQEVSAGIAEEKSSRLFPRASLNGRFFFRTVISGLEPGAGYSFDVKAGNERKTLKSSTLKAPAGEKLCSFAIFADPHIAGPDTTADLPVERGPRLYSKAAELLKNSIEDAASKGAGSVVLPGDIADPASPENMAIVTRLRQESPLPWYPLIGNHEPHCSGGEARFCSEFNLPPGGWYAEDFGNHRFLFTGTVSQDSLNERTEQYAWLIAELGQHRDRPCVLFSHFAGLLHPCVQGNKNDGMQELYNAGRLRQTLKRHPQLKAWFAGHKNVPSLVVKNGLAHFLSPQLIQAPCGYDIIDVYENGLVRMYHEIERQDIVWLARTQGYTAWTERIGTEEARNAVIEYGEF